MSSGKSNLGTTGGTAPTQDSSIGPMGSLGIRNYMDMYITNQFMSQMSTMMNAGQMDFMVIFYIIILSSINEIKNYLKIFLDLVMEKGSEILKKIPNSCMGCTMIRWRKKMPTTKIVTSPANNEEKINLITIELKPTLTTIKSIMAYLRKNPSICSFQRSNKYNVEVQNLNEMKITETLSAIKISLKNFIVEILDDFKLDYTISKSKNILADYSIVAKNADKNKNKNITSLTELIEDPAMKKYFIEQYNSLKARFPFDEATSPIYDLTSSWINGALYKADAFKSQKFISENYSSTYDSISDSTFLNEIFLMLTIYQTLATKGHPYRFVIIENYYHSVVFGIKIKFPVAGLSFYNLGIIEPNLSTANKYLTAVKTYQETIDFNNNDDDDDDDESTQDDLSLKIHSNMLNEETLYNEFMEWFGKLNDYNEFTEKRDKVTMNYLSLERIVEVKEISNPDYEAYLEKRKLVSGDSGDSSQTDSDDEKKSTDKKSKKRKSSKSKKKSNGLVSSMMMAEMFKESVPPKMIKETHIHKKIKCQEISEISKNFSTLYLRESDTFKLEQSLETFYSKKELFEELGLQHKLGVLLYGPPGTGKTSTIYAIGTYLKKNLFYINLNDIETNAELQLIFDYVNKNCINGGIIIFEDIDAMTKIVHKRSVDPEKERDMTVSEIVSSKNDKLTLEYFLNLLQGSLTQTGTIYIATTNHLEVLDPAFYRDGRFDVKIEMKKCDRYQINMIYKNFYKRNIPGELLARIREDYWTPANIIFHIKNFMFGSYTDAEILAFFM